MREGEERALISLVSNILNSLILSITVISIFLFSHCFVFHLQRIRFFVKGNGMRELQTFST